MQGESEWARAAPVNAAVHGGDKALHSTTANGRRRFSDVRTDVRAKLVMHREVILE